MARDSNRNLTLEVIRTAEKPLSPTEIGERTIAMGGTNKLHSFSPSVTQWYHRADKGWQHVSRVQAPRDGMGNTPYLYSFDGNLNRSPVARKQVPTQRKSNDVTLRENLSPDSKGKDKEVSTRISTETFGRIIPIPEFGYVLVIDQAGQVIKGRYLE